MKLQTFNFSTLVNDIVNCGKGCQCDQDHDHITYRTQCVIEPVIISIGATLDVLALLVLTRKCMLSSSTVYLTAMTTYDILYLLFYCSNLYRPCNHSLLESEAYHWYHRYVGEPVMTLFSNCNSATICLISLERFFAVCKPHYYSAWAVVDFSVRLTTGTFFLVLLLTLPEFFREDFDEQMDQYGYEWIVDALFTYLPILFLAVCNSFIVYGLYRENQKRKTLDHHKRHAAKPEESVLKKAHATGYSRLTVILIIIVCAFILCELPGAMLTSYHNYVYFNRVYFTDHEVHHFKIAVELCKLLYPINTAVNFVVYVALSRKFRETAKATFFFYRRLKSR